MIKKALMRSGLAALAFAAVTTFVGAPAASAAPSYSVGDTVAVSTLVDQGTVIHYYVKYAMRVCDTYAMVPSNKNQSTNAESALPVQGPNPYASASDFVVPATEDDPGSSWSSCSKETGWDFKLGTGVSHGSTGAGVTNPYAQFWIDNGNGTATLSTSITTRSSIFGIPGATAVLLTPDQYAELLVGHLTTSLVKRSNPGFATMRCGDDRNGGDNTETVMVNAGAERTYCYAYASREKPAKLTVKIVAQTNGNPCPPTAFGFDGSGNLSGGGSTSWKLGVCGSSTADTIVFPNLAGNATYLNHLNFPLPAGWSFGTLGCVDDGASNAHGTISGTPAANASVTLLPGDAATCTYAVTLDAPLATTSSSTATTAATSSTMSSSTSSTTLGSSSTTANTVSTSSPSSSVAGNTVVATTTVNGGASSATLPRTGYNSGVLVLIGVALAGLGALFVGINRRWAR